jgi:uncharacterized membrane protein YozB (DUF420 family)
MSVIEPSCRLPSEHSPGCACATPTTTAGKAAATASVTALAATACVACCVLPFILPASLLALAGGSLAVLGYAHLWVTRLAVAAVVAGWLWIVWQRRKTGRRVTRATMALMILATLLTTAAASWPLLEPAVFKSLGIVKKAASQSG